MARSENKTTTLQGTCPACFGTFALVESRTTGDLRLARHGWSEMGGRQVGSYGHAWHVGACFGVGHKPFEVSPEGTIAFVSEVVFPSALNAQRARDHYATRPAIVRDYSASYLDGYRYEDAPYQVRFQPGDERSHDRRTSYPSYEQVWSATMKQAEAVLENINTTGTTLCDRIRTWAAAEVTDRPVKGPVVHYIAEGARKPACVRLRYPAGMRTTNDKAKTTCTRCRKALGLNA